MVPGDVAGVVSDGPDTQLDIDYKMDKSEVTVTFSGYESERDGVAHYQWAVGSAPRLDDVMPYSYVNLIEEDGGTDGMLGKMTQTLLCIKSSLLSDINSEIKLNQQDYFCFSCLIIRHKKLC